MYLGVRVNKEFILHVFHNLCNKFYSDTMEFNLCRFIRLETSAKNRDIDKTTLVGIVDDRAQGLLCA